jgi:hypothetical protein
MSPHRLVRRGDVIWKFNCATIFQITGGAHIPQRRQPLGDDPAPCQASAITKHYKLFIPEIYSNLTNITIWLTTKSPPQGCTSWLSSTAMYLCSKMLFEAIGASGMDGRYYHGDASWLSSR